ncbi:family 20 glycosylhydrolase [uncultured Sphingomonas sp.]|uniref:beta-N-acetylhexosaminidase n=1 Tax=uncultured Sphingomonas sp. TaxID=158754 RepID=UPI0025973FC9|nr:family 20 glycosylhydrolase [uncultured Sphingomonas sp.]
MIRSASLLLATTLIAAGAPASAGSASHSATRSAPLPLVPMPQSVIRGAGRFLLTDGAAIGTAPGDAGAAAAARLLSAQVKAARGLVLRPTIGQAAVRFVRDPSVAGDEAYRLDVTPRGIVIAASGDRGFVHGAATLAQLASPGGMMGHPAAIPAVSIADAPRFSWRGLMIDPSRHFQPIEFLYRTVDRMAAVKLNTLHLHLSDDQGWRFEVKRYPRLTEIGAWRTPPSTGGSPAAKVGGFYTQEQLKALVAYAAERGITIVPEIDLPGHAQALVAAYPEHGVFGDRPDVGHDWGVNPYLLNPDAKTVRFVEDILDEVMAVFPGTYIHLGGDEAVKDQWQRSPAVQAQMAAVGAKTENEMQSWLIDQFGAYLASKGRRLIGWDEILEGGVPPSASVMSWRGDKGAVDAANKGHDVVLSPAPNLYLDNLQSDLPDEPNGRIGIQTLEAVYGYDPMPAGINADKARHVLGAQANAWSEYLVTPYQVDHNVYPRLGALAEVTWSPKSARDFSSFSRRIVPQMARWRRDGGEVADSAFAVAYALQGSRSAALRSGRLTVALKTQVSLGTIRYTTDGSPPTPRSRVYSAPIGVASGTPIRAAAFLEGDMLAAPRPFETSRVSLLSATPSDLVACPMGALGLRVPLTSEATANAPVFNVNLFDTCTAWKGAPLANARSIAVAVARLPRNYGLAHDFTALRGHFNVTPYGELVVTAGCPVKDGPKTPVIATFPLPDPAKAPTQFRFDAPIPAGMTDADLCFQFTSPLSDPFYAVERVQLSEGVR